MKQMGDFFHFLGRHHDSGWWAAAGTWATFLVAVAAALFAYRQVREARASREAQSQPFIAVSLEPSTEVATLLILKVENIGQTLARDVKISFDPPLKPIDEAESYLNTGGLFTEGIRSMPPRMKFERVFDNMIEWGEGGAMQTVWAYDVTVDFADHRGKQQEPLSYRIDLTHLMIGTYIERRTVHHLAGALDEVRKEMKKWTEFGGGGLNVISRDGDAKDERKRAQYEERRRQIAAQTDGTSATS